MVWWPCHEMLKWSHHLFHNYYTLFLSGFTFKRQIYVMLIMTHRPQTAKSFPTIPIFWNFRHVSVSLLFLQHCICIYVYFYFCFNSKDDPGHSSKFFLFPFTSFLFPFLLRIGRGSFWPKAGGNVWTENIKNQARSPVGDLLCSAVPCGCAVLYCALPCCTLNRAVISY